MDIIYTAHLVGCGFYAISKNDEQRNWILSVDEPGNDSPLEKYILSLYWSCITMTTIGYGDIGPIN